ncbi:cell filamentation protein Fic [Lewinellaceae bacterium SD302]|nr:cell filamentation protein Fic [Lewinellaceae bacterium SD302]
MHVKDFKAGYYAPQGHYQAFVPHSINHDWTLADAELESALALANRKLGALDAFAGLVPSIDSFINLHIAKEATTSSKIEGTKTNIEEAFLPVTEVKPELRDDWKEVRNYIDAMNFAIGSLGELPLSSRLIRNTHKILLDGVRGNFKQPGEFRRSQNWIGGATIQQARFVPPPFNVVGDLIGDIEKFIHNRSIHVSELIRIGITHYQFETIHPFLDGNGRTGRLLITLQMIDAGYLRYPVLYLSDFIERNRSEYYDRLNRVRTENDLRGWLLYFLRGIAEVSEDGVKTLSSVVRLKEKVNDKLAQTGRRYANAQRLVARLYENPVIDVNATADLLQLKFKAAGNLITELEQLGIIQEVTGQQRNRIFAFRPYLNLFR